MSLQLGYLLPTRERIMVGKHEVQEILALGDLADELGVDSVWIGDSLLAKPRHDPLALIGAIAGRTKRVKIGTAVLLPMLRNPVLLAHQVATLDQIAEGRMILGVGTAGTSPPSGTNSKPLVCRLKSVSAVCWNRCVFAANCGRENQSTGRVFGPSSKAN